MPSDISSTDVHPAVADYLRGRELKSEYAVDAIAERHGLSRQRIYQLVQEHEKGKGPALANSNGTEDITPGEGVNVQDNSTSPATPCATVEEKN